MSCTFKVADIRPGGILRVDITKPRRSSGSSVEFRQQPEFLGLVSYFLPLYQITAN